MYADLQKTSRLKINHNNETIALKALFRNLKLSGKLQDRLKAHVRMRQELQISYFGTQNKFLCLKPNPQNQVT